MKKKITVPIFSTPAAIWDGTNQLPGTLELWETKIFFRLKNFKDSHLNLRIPLTEIEKIEEYLVFDLAKNGLKIQSKNGQFDLFVLEEGNLFKNLIREQIKKSDQ